MCVRVCVCVLVQESYLHVDKVIFFCVSKSPGIVVKAEWND